MTTKKYVETIVESAKKRLFYKSNIQNIDNDELNDLLSGYCLDGMKIVKKWRKLSDYSDFENGYWAREIIEFVINSYNMLGSENVYTSSSGGNSRTYNMSPESRLKTSIPQVC